MAVRLKWKGPDLKRFTHGAAMQGLRAAGLELHGIAREMASISNAGEARTRTRDTERGKKGSQYTVYPKSSHGARTPPGESPRRRSGFGQKNIVLGWDNALGSVRVGYTANARYMTYHELGIRYRKVGLQYRQTITPAMANNLTRLERIAEFAAQNYRGK